MLRAPAVATVCACAVMLGACGSTTTAAPAAETGRKAEIESALRKLQTEGEQSEAELCHKLGGANVLNTITLVEPGPPPKGVSATEWHAAVKQDRELQRFNCPAK